MVGKMNFSFILLSCLLMGGWFGNFGTEAATLDPDEEEQVVGLIKSQLDSNGGDWVKDAVKPEEIHRYVVEYLQGLDLQTAFQRTTGYKLETVLIIIACVMLIPGIVINILFLICSTLLKGGKAVACCACSAAGSVACCCCCKLCKRAICPCCAKKESSQS